MWPTPRTRRSPGRCSPPDGSRRITRTQRYSTRTTSLPWSSCAATSTSIAACGTRSATWNRCRRGPWRASPAARWPETCAGCAIEAGRRGGVRSGRRVRHFTTRAVRCSRVSARARSGCRPLSSAGSRWSGGKDRRPARAGPATNAQGRRRRPRPPDRSGSLAAGLVRDAAAQPRGPGATA